MCNCLQYGENVILLVMLGTGNFQVTGKCLGIILEKGARVGEGASL